MATKHYLFALILLTLVPNREKTERELYGIWRLIKDEFEGTREQCQDKIEEEEEREQRIYENLHLSGQRQNVDLPQSTDFTEAG